MIQGELLCCVLKAGVHKAAIIEIQDVVLSASFRDICAGNACGMYNRCWQCPPDIGEIDALMDTFRQYQTGILYQTVYKIEDSFDIEGMGASARCHAQVSQQVNDAMKEALHVPFLHLSCGGCNLCERCAKVDGLPCRFPEKALPPMEGYGIDVYQTTACTDLKYINGQNTVTFFGLVAF